MPSSETEGGSLSSDGPTMIERVREVRERLIASGTVVAPDGVAHALFPVAIGPVEGCAIRDLIIEEGAMHTFETGLGYAMSTLWICDGLVSNGPGASHVAMDPYQLESAPASGTSYAGVGLRTLEEAGIRSLVEFHEQESQIVLPRLLEEGRMFDLAFVDGNHRFEAVFLDLVYAGRLLGEGGVVVVDDMQLPAIRRAVEFCIDNLGWTIEGSGSEGSDHAWSVLRTGDPSRFQRAFTEFADFRVERAPTGSVSGRSASEVGSDPTTLGS